MDQHQKANGSFLGRRRILAANLVLLFLVAWGFAGELARNNAMKRDVARLEEQARKLEDENFDIAKLGQKFAAADVLEREARLNLGLQKPGESVIIIKETTPPPPAQPPEATGSAESRPRESNALKWWRYFFHQKP
ncbi:MAG: septum formation initiator family protein [Patescibacteria group bacterium]|jgi:cell division protein FtsB